jgi:ribose 1,5-bisphosphokinase
MSEALLNRGTLFLIVGPSGAGKDSVVDGLRARLGTGGRISFPRRYITRDKDAAGETHDSVSEARFREMQLAGEFMLHWHAHGLDYGIGMDTQADLHTGRHVVVNVSRSVVDWARRAFQPVKVLQLHINELVLRDRLVTRARETADEIERRVARASGYRVEGSDVVSIDNSGPLEQTISAAAQLILLSAPELETLG